MAIPAEVLKTIELIDAKIAEMMRAKAALRDAFGGNGDYSKKADEKQLVLGVTAGATRRQTLLNFFMQHGPATRQQIMTSLPDIPEGTLAYLLNEKKGFKKNSAGLWDVAVEGAQKN